VEGAVARGAGHAREGKGPYFLECRTYRFRAHSMFDTEIYRTREEVAEWKKRDPILLLEGVLRKQKTMSDADLERLRGDVEREVDAAVAFAEAGTWEPVEELTRFVHSERRTG
jgi:pyruvate dehydrogenase E1 component alpha subunit